MFDYIFQCSQMVSQSRFIHAMRSDWHSDGMSWTLYMTFSTIILTSETVLRVSWWSVYQKCSSNPLMYQSNGTPVCSQIWNGGNPITSSVHFLYKSNSKLKSMILSQHQELWHTSSALLLCQLIPRLNQWSWASRPCNTSCVNATLVVNGEMVAGRRYNMTGGVSG